MGWWGEWVEEEGRIVARTVVVANHKGGVGKTTTAVNLATGLADMGRRVLLVDTDPQGNVGAFLGLEPDGGLFSAVVGKQPVDDVALPIPDHPNLSVILSDESTVDINTLLVSGSRRIKARTAIADVLAPVWRNGKTIVILDTAPSLSAVQVSALAASDWLIIPANPEFGSEAGMAQLAQAVGELRAQGSKLRLLGILPTLVLTRSREHRATQADLEETFPGLVLPPVRRLIALGEAPRAGKPIWTYAPRSEAAKDYAAVLGEVIRRGGF
jgi:chromosome partitioning protein